MERQTLKELMNDEQGLPEEEAWRLFRQLVDALVHMASLNIVSFVSWILLIQRIHLWLLLAPSRHQTKQYLHWWVSCMTLFYSV